jgi:regulator of protease activity HflC (stomatin/prohibitin superfamily)
MGSTAGFLITLVMGFLGTPIAIKIFLGFMRLLGMYAAVQERTVRVYVLFGKVVTILDEPGLHLLWLKMGPKAMIVNWIGTCHVLDLRLDQQYLRSLAVNSEEGAPIGIGVWYEMYVSDPVAFLFRNTDPRGSLAANVSNAAVRSLSNMKLGDMMETRHTMSRTVRAEVSPRSDEWGYKLGSVYIRKVHFRDHQMIRQIEEKVVNRLRQVTSAIKQDGANQVSVITSSAEREAAVEFAKARALRPQIVGEALHRISRDPEIAEALFELLEIEKLLTSEAEITLLPENSGLAPMLAGMTRPNPPPALPRG